MYDCDPDSRQVWNAATLYMESVINEMYDLILKDKSKEICIEKFVYDQCNKFGYFRYLKIGEIIKIGDLRFNKTENKLVSLAYLSGMVNNDLTDICRYKHIDQPDNIQIAKSDEIIYVDIKDGVVFNIEDVPNGYTVVVRDYDVESDKYGEPYKKITFGEV